MKYILAFLLMLSVPCWAQVPMTGAGKSAGAAPPAYTGPGDVVSGASAWYSCAFGYNAADTANACNVCLPSDTVCADITLSNGVAVVPGSLSTCNNSTVICTVKTAYDKSGAAACSGACNVTNATIANRPTFFLNDLGTSPCMRFNGSSQQLTSSANWGSTTSQPWSMNAVLNSTFNSSFAGIIQVGVQFGLITANTANNVALFAGGVVSQAMTDGSFHSLQGVANGASSFLYVDQTASTLQNALAGSLTSGNAVIIGIFNNSTFFLGDICEAGIWPIGFTGTTSSNSLNTGNLATNQHTRYGF